MEMARRTCLAFVLAFLAAFCLAQINDDDPCGSDQAKESCAMCIQASSRCSWCPHDPNITFERRCRLASDALPPCPVMEQNPRPSLVIIKDENLTTSDTQTEGVRAVQVSPQNISISLRRGQPETFNMTFRSLRNSPLDLYFLIDFSSSQNIVVGILQTDLPEIGEAVMNGVSTNFRMGYGSFVDKPTLPYALDDYRLNSSVGGLRCRGFDECVPTYSFRNSQPLTPNITELEVAFNASSELSSNIDSPEGSLDALLQAAICTNETGWRPNALHMVFLITDQGYHVAGDGKLGGIYQPNDGLCHQAVGESGELEYTEALVQDYPSLFQIRNSLESNLIVPIFTLRSSRTSAARVNASLLPSYQMLADDLSATRARAVVFQDTSVDEIIRVIRESYDETVQNIRVNIPAQPGYSFTIDPVEGCDEMNDDGSCLLQFDEEVTFRVTVTLDSCEDPNKRRVQLLGPPFSFTTIDLEPLCGCNCSVEPGPEVDSPLCALRGDLECGLCDCSTGNIPFFGAQCECDVDLECPVDAMGQDCSGRGDCSCGMCRCSNGTSGSFCQCTEGDCNEFGGCLNGGRCSCPADIPVCICPVSPTLGMDFFGRRCQCDPADCFNPLFPTEVCHIFAPDGSDGGGGTDNGRQRCECGGCNCPDGFVLEDSTCRPQGCTAQINLCAQCVLNATVNNCSACPVNISDIRFLGNPPDIFTRTCNYEIQGCDYTFYLDFGGNMLSLSYVRLGCTNQALPWIITGSLVGAIVLLGLLFLIILKLLLVAWDRHEYKKFEHELKDADFAPVDNPLYHTPQQEYQNPIHRKRVPQQPEPL